MAKFPLHLFENGTKINVVNSKVVPSAGDRLWYNYTYYDVKLVTYVSDANDVTDFRLEVEKVNPQPAPPIPYDEMKNGIENAEKEKKH